MNTTFNINVNSTDVRLKKRKLYNISNKQILDIIKDHDGLYINEISELIKIKHSIVIDRGSLQFRLYGLMKENLIYREKNNLINYRSFIYKHTRKKEEVVKPTLDLFSDTITLIDNLKENVIKFNSEKKYSKEDIKKIFDEIINTLE